jgi:thymidylate synthase
MNYSQKARNLTNRLNAISKEVNETFKQFHKETNNTYVSKPNLTIAKMNSLKKLINTFKPENFENFNASVKLQGAAKTKYYKQLRNLKKKALNVFDNKQKRTDLVKGKKLSRANAITIVEGSKLNLK